MYHKADERGVGSAKKVSGLRDWKAIDLQAAS